LQREGKSTDRKGTGMKGPVKYLAIMVLSLLCTAQASGESVWKKATSLYGSNADRYLYLALPHAANDQNRLLPLIKEGDAYFVRSASYTISVRNGSQKDSFKVGFSVKKRKLNIRGMKDNIIIDIGEKEVYDITYTVGRGKEKTEYHNYFQALPKEAIVQLFPGFFGSKLFGRFDNSRENAVPEFIGWRITEGKKGYERLDPSSYSDMGAKPFESGDSSLLKKRSLLDYATKNWGLISELRIWNIFHYGINKPKERRLTGFLKIEFYVKPVSEPLRFGNVTLPFSNIWYEVNYKLSSELAKAAILASDDSLIPKRSHFIFKKKTENGKIDFEIEIDIDQIEFAGLDTL